MNKVMVIAFIVNPKNNGMHRHKLLHVCEMIKYEIQVFSDPE
jgi:hypothetical protein